MSSLRDRSTRLRPKSRGKSLSLLAAFALLVCPLAAPTAHATPPTPTAAMYLDQPFVEGSYVAEQYPSETSVTTFDDQTAGYPGDTCSFTGATVDTAVYPAQDCHVWPHSIFGGASSSASTPTVGQDQTLTNFGAVGGGGVSITFNTPQTYFGMWWSAGSYGNLVQLQDGSDVVASVSADDVQNTINQTAYLTSGNNDYYASRFYLGNPYGWSTVGTPSNFTDLDADNTYVKTGNVDPYEAFVFIHFIAAPGTTFNRVNMIAPGNGFEFDNFTTSSSTDIATNIPSRLVLQRQLYAPNHVTFEANGGTGAMATQYSTDNSPAYLNYTCMPPYTDPTRCISAPNNSYSTQSLGWNTEPDGSGTSYYFDNWQPYSFNESMTVYAQWQSNFSYRYLNYSGTDFNADVTGDTVWQYVDENYYQDFSVRNFADITLPSPERQGQHLEGWYTFSSDYQLIRAGSPGEVISSSSYTQWDPNMFGRWVDDPPPPPPSVDAITPQVLPVYPRATSVQLPNLPLSGDAAASICVVESDPYGNEVSSNLQFTDLGTSSSGFSSSYLISEPSALVRTQSRYVRVTVSAISDPSCSTGVTHVVEIRLLGANLSQIGPLYLHTH